MLWGFCLSVCLLFSLVLLPLQFRINSTDLRGNRQIWSTQVGMCIPEPLLDLCKERETVGQVAVGHWGRRTLSPTHPWSQGLPLLIPKPSVVHFPLHCLWWFLVLCMGWLPSAAPGRSVPSLPTRRPLRTCPKSTHGDTYIYPLIEEEGGKDVLFCMCFQCGLRLLAGSQCSPVLGKVWDSPVLENILLALFQTLTLLTLQFLNVG